MFEQASLREKRILTLAMLLVMTVFFSASSLTLSSEYKTQPLLLQMAAERLDARLSVIGYQAVARS